MTAMGVSTTFARRETEPQYVKESLCCSTLTKSFRPQDLFLPCVGSEGYVDMGSVWLAAAAIAALLMPVTEAPSGLAEAE
jgi:hypothetical protein